MLAAGFVGALLGLGGVIYQGVFRNPLAEPYLLGSAGGAALGATVALLVPLVAPQSLTLPLLAFAGAWGATVLVIGISRVAGAVESAGLLPAGVAGAAIRGSAPFRCSLCRTRPLACRSLSCVGRVQTPS